jgi:hypothetical protein
MISGSSSSIRGKSRRRVAAVVLAAVLGACGGGKGGDGTSSGPRLLSLRPVLSASAPPCPPGGDIQPLLKEGKPVECLRLGTSITDDRDVRSASYSFNLEQAQPEVAIVLGSTGSANLDDFAAGHLGQRLAIVVNGKAVSAPTIRSASFLGRIVVTGLSKPEAEDLFKRLKSRSG